MLFQLSRAIEAPNYSTNPTTELLVGSLLLSVASHYASRPTRGWVYSSEAIILTRAMCLGEKSGYEGIGVVEAEIRKRAFWLGYIIQVHDRISSEVPHIGVSYLPHSVEWDEIIPLSLHDETLQSLSTTSTMEGVDSCESCETPLIAGFVALIKVFLCCVEFYSHGLPGSIAQTYTTATAPQNCSLATYASSPDVASPGHVPHHFQRLDMVHRMFRNLNSVIEHLPPELKLPTTAPNSSSLTVSPTSQFSIMRANIHVTSLYLQSGILETFENSLKTDDPRLMINDNVEEPSVRSQIFRFRQSIAKELLNTMEFCPPSTLEPNGASMVIKIREIASSLLEVEGEHDSFDGVGGLNNDEVRRFIDILASLDWGARQGEPASLSREGIQHLSDRARSKYSEVLPSQRSSI